MQSIKIMLLSVVLLLVLVRLSSNPVEGLPAGKIHTSKAPSTSSNFRYISINDITEDDEEFNDDAPGELTEEGETQYYGGEQEIDDDLSGDFSDGPNYDDPFRGRKRKFRSDGDLWKINMNRTKANENFFQSDIHLDLIQNLKLKVQENFEEVDEPQRKRVRRAIRAPEKGPQNKYLWKDNTIFYKIDNVFRKNIKFEIKRGIRHWKRHLKGCLKFVRLDRNPELEKNVSRDFFGGGPVEHILFTKTESGCWSQVGRTDTRLDEREYVPGQQLISIGEGCGERGTVIHEIGHAIGFWHEQSRRDRDEYVNIVRRNIIPGQKGQFKRMAKDQVNSMEYAYDYWSIMHYGPYFFSRNDKPTIKVRGKFRSLKPNLGQRESLSYLDIAQVRAMYKCNVIPSRESKKTCVSKKTKGSDYRGTLDYTRTGVMCQPWNRNYPHEVKYDIKNKDYGLKVNYCRNPGGEKERPWCYTTLADKNGNPKWDYCDIEVCDES